MSMIVCSQDDLGRVNRRVWGRIFGLFIRKGRERKGYSVEQVAGLAGLEPSTWTAFEAGRVPGTVVQLRSMAGALEFSDVQLATMVQLCRDAWPA
jgi:transcriptional regulator with XRE-family HTH domain